MSLTGTVVNHTGFMTVAAAFLTFFAEKQNTQS